MAPERTRRGSRLAATPWNQVGLGGALSPSSAMREAPRVRLARDHSVSPRGPPDRRLSREAHE